VFIYVALLRLFTKITLRTVRVTIEAGWQTVFRENTSNDMANTQVQTNQWESIPFLLLAAYFSALKTQTAVPSDRW